MEFCVSPIEDNNWTVKIIRCSYFLHSLTLKEYRYFDALIMETV